MDMQKPVPRLFYQYNCELTMELPIRALLLAAGFGTRLRPITLTKPKCLVEIGGKPLLQHWIEKLEKLGCEKVLLNKHYLSDQVDNFISENIFYKKIIVSSVYEQQLKGTAGTLIENKEFFEQCTGMIIHADNMPFTDLTEFIDAHRRRPKYCDITMLTFNSDQPSSCGIVEVDKLGVVQAFYEKVINPPGNIANGAVYLFDPPFLDKLYQLSPAPNDISTELIPHLMGNIYTWHTNRPYYDIGTPENLSKAKISWEVFNRKGQ